MKRPKPHEAEVHVNFPRSAVEDWHKGFYTADVEVAIAQDPNCIVVRGTYSQVLKCLVDDLGIASDEAPSFIVECAKLR